MIGPRPWKVLYREQDRQREPAATYSCALAGRGGACTMEACPDSTARNLMGWDHCHVHGFIRGPLCCYHNGRMGRFDSGHPRFANDPDLIEYSRRCAGCAPSDNGQR